MKTGVSVIDAMTSNPITVFDHISVEDCAKVMKKNKIGSLVILKKGKIVGILTQEDIVFKVTAERLKLSTPVSKVMEKKVVTIAPNTDIYDALVLLRDNNIRQVPVVNGEKLVGILSVKDILNIQPQLYEILYEQAQMRR